MNRQNRKFAQKKSLGQVFLTETWPCQKMVQKISQVNAGQILEIGPGAGALTRHLLKLPNIKLLAVEKDHRFFEKLQSEFHSEPKFQVLNQDIVHFDIAEWLTQTKGPHVICGNIPYNLSSAIMNKILPHMESIKLSMLMVQLEFAERLLATPSQKAYGSLSIYLQLRAKGVFEFQVPKTAFKPVPKVDSAVISLTVHPKKPSDEILSKVEEMTLKAFSARRKKISNSMASYIESWNGTFPFDLNRRCETLSPEDFVQIAQGLVNPFES